LEGFFVDKRFDPTRDLYDTPEPAQESATLELSGHQKKEVTGVQDSSAGKSLRQSPSGGYIPDPGSSVSRVPAIRYPSSAKNRYGIHSVSIRENIAPKEHIRIYGSLGPITTLFALGFLVAVLAIGLVNKNTFSSAPAPATDPGYLPSNDSQPAAIVSGDSLPESGTFVEPLFGPFAVHQCASRCQTRPAPASENCLRGCSMYQLSIYGRRISFDRYDPVMDSEEIVNRCTKRDFAIPTHTSGSLWEEETNSGLQLLEESADIYKHADISLLHTHYLQLLDSSRRLRMPPGGTAVELGLTRDLARSFCLDANFTLTSLALNAAMQAGDETSERYYRRIAQSLEPKVSEFTTKASVSATTLKLR